jgi:orotidine-5'-phosphate decarboxylase
MQIQEHTQTARDFLNDADHQFSSGHTLQGSEKLWGAAAHAVMTVAQERGWAYENHDALKLAVLKLITEHHAQELRAGFAAALQFRANFYHSFMEDCDVELARPLVHDFVERVLISSEPRGQGQSHNAPLPTFNERLATVTEQNQSRLCVGLDPELSSNGDFDPKLVLDLNKAIIESSHKFACAYKPNLAIYESMGYAGLTVLEKTMRFIRELNPNMPIIGDAKRGDIGPCSLAYVRTMFDSFDFDAVTVSPYMGSDSLEPFIEHRNRGVFVLCRTSNPGGADFQDLTVVDERDDTRMPLYEVVARHANTWNRQGNVGLVVGATVPAQMRRIREAVPDMLFLIPGIGVQGGDLAQTVSSAVDSRGKGFIINASRKIMYAAQTSTGKHRTNAEARKRVKKVARKLRNDINAELAKEPMISSMISERVRQTPVPVG